MAVQAWLCCIRLRTSVVCLCCATRVHEPGWYTTQCTPHWVGSRAVLFTNKPTQMSEKGKVPTSDNRDGKEANR